MTHEPTRPRARQLGVPFAGTPGARNAIIDVQGVEVGHRTLISGEGARVRGKGPVRTGVTVVLPRGRSSMAPTTAGVFSLNGTGELTGAHAIEELGIFIGPIGLTNTFGIGAVHEGILRWMTAEFPDINVALPVVGECFDGDLSDIHGFHVRPEHVLEAIAAADGESVPEGAVGAGTGTVCFDFKGGIGTSSRRVEIGPVHGTVGVLVQTNCGARDQLLIGGLPLGKNVGTPSALSTDPEAGSIIVLIATDVPGDATLMRRLAKRGALGLARTGATAGAFSGDLFLAFSTAEHTGDPSVDAGDDEETYQFRNALFAAVAHATEEAIVNSMFAAVSMSGADDLRVPGLPVDDVMAQLTMHRLAMPDRVSEEF